MKAPSSPNWCPGPVWRTPPSQATAPPAPAPPRAGAPALLARGERRPEPFLGWVVGGRDRIRPAAHAPTRHDRAGVDELLPGVDAQRLLAGPAHARVRPP